jgi:hypothetical protein
MKNRKGFSQVAVKLQLADRAEGLASLRADHGQRVLDSVDRVTDFYAKLEGIGLPRLPRGVAARQASRAGRMAALPDERRQRVFRMLDDLIAVYAAREGAAMPTETPSAQARKYWHGSNVIPFPGPPRV